MSNLKEKIISRLGSITGLTSILGSWQICHNVCLGLIAVVALMGITLTGMPLAFLTKVAIPFWSAAVLFLAITFWFYFKKKCISSNMLLFNSGLIIAGTPFAAVQVYNPILWSVGGILAGTGTIRYAYNKFKNNKSENNKFKIEEKTECCKDEQERTNK